MSKTCVLEQECHTKMANNGDGVQHGLSSIDHSNTLWPFDSKSAKTLKHEQTETCNTTPLPPGILLRTSSLDRIRQFPAYLCRRGSNSVLFWLYNSRSAFREAVESLHKQLRGLFLALCVYLAIGLVVVQIAVCCAVMSIAAPTLPYGFMFMIACIVIVITIALKTIPHDKEKLHSQ